MFKTEILKKDMTKEEWRYCENYFFSRIIPDWKKIKVLQDLPRNKLEILKKISPSISLEITFLSIKAQVFEIFKDIKTVGDLKIYCRKNNIDCDFKNQPDSMKMERSVLIHSVTRRTRTITFYVASGVKRTNLLTIPISRQQQ